MAAAQRGGGGDPRDVSQEDHQSPWLTRVDNRGAGFISRAMGKEATLLKGSKVKACKVYELKPAHFSVNPKITKLNEAIVKKVNTLEAERMDYLSDFEIVSVPERNVKVRNIRNLIAQIRKLQSAVQVLGGTYFPLPKDFDDVKDL